MRQHAKQEVLLLCEQELLEGKRERERERVGREGGRERKKIKQLRPV